MISATKRNLVVLAVVGLALGLGLVAWIALRGRSDETESWKPAVEGFLAVATPCCTEASLWDTLDAVRADGQRARAASIAEAVLWLDGWPYRSGEVADRTDQAQLSIALQSREVRCTGPPTGDEIPRDASDEETLEAIRLRRECVFAKWKVWSGETATARDNERHTVWADEDGFFHGRVDYWRLE